METVARSIDLFGPYESNPANPILTNANTSSYCGYNDLRVQIYLNSMVVQTVGHADLFQDARGNWYVG